MKSNKNLFLVGGYDLEMITIKDLLVRNGYVDISKSKDFSQTKCFADKNLGWGAKVNSYEDFFDFDGIIYGVELEEPKNWQKPKNYSSIDHHNERENEKSSIEQVADVLMTPLNRHQQLVAHNDKGYIPAMEKFGATPDEISNIRYADRQAQGVTDKDEKLAEKSIQKNLELKNGVTVIKSLTNKFSPLTDRRYGLDKHLIIYTAKNLCYYGCMKNIITNHFRHLLESKKAYSGGGDNGFFGIKDNVFSESELENRIIPEIIKIISNG